MANILNRYGIKEVADVTFYEKREGGLLAPVLYLDTLKISTTEQTAENTEAKGGKGNSSLISWDYGKEITLNLEDALFSHKSLSMLFGGEGVDFTSDESTQVQTIWKDSAVDITINGTDVTAKVNGKAVILRDAVLYKEDGSLGDIQDYVFIKGTLPVSGHKIDISAEAFPGVYYVTGDTIVRNEKTGQDEMFQLIIPKAKVVSESNTITMEAEGDPTVFSFQIKALKPKNEPMMSLIQYQYEQGEVTPIPTGEVFDIPKREVSTDSECVITTTCPTTHTPTLASIKSIMGDTKETVELTEEDYDFIPTTNLTTENTWALRLKNLNFAEKNYVVTTTYESGDSSKTISKAGDHALDLVAIFDKNTYINGTYIIKANTNLKLRIAGIQAAQYYTDKDLEKNIRFISAEDYAPLTYFEELSCEEQGTGTGNWKITFDELSDDDSLEPDYDGIRLVRFILTAESRIPTEEVFNVPKSYSSECVIITECPTTYEPTLVSVTDADGTEYEAKDYNFDFIPTTENKWALRLKGSFLSEKEVNVKIIYESESDYSPEKITTAGIHQRYLVNMFESNYLDDTYIIEADTKLKLYITEIDVADHTRGVEGQGSNIHFIDTIGGKTDKYVTLGCEEVETGKWAINFVESEGVNTHSDYDGVRLVRFVLTAAPRIPKEDKFVIPKNENASECVIITTCPTTYEPTLESITGDITGKKYGANTDYNFDFIPTTGLTTESTWALRLKNLVLDEKDGNANVKITYKLKLDQSPEKITEAGEHDLDLVAIFESNTYTNGTYTIEADEDLELHVAEICTAAHAPDEESKDSNEKLKNNIHFINEMGSPVLDPKYFTLSCEESGARTGKWKITFDENESLMDADYDGIRLVHFKLNAQQR